MARLILEGDTDEITALLRAVGGRAAGGRRKGRRFVRAGKGLRGREAPVGADTPPGLWGTSSPAPEPPGLAGAVAVEGRQVADPRVIPPIINALAAQQANPGAVAAWQEETRAKTAEVPPTQRFYWLGYAHALTGRLPGCRPAIAVRAEGEHAWRADWYRRGWEDGRARIFAGPPIAGRLSDTLWAAGCRADFKDWIVYFRHVDAADGPEMWMEDEDAGVVFRAAWAPLLTAWVADGRPAPGEDLASPRGPAPFPGEAPGLPAVADAPGLAETAIFPPLPGDPVIRPGGGAAASVEVEEPAPPREARHAADEDPQHGRGSGPEEEGSER